MPSSAPSLSPASPWQATAQRITDAGSAVPARIDLDQPRSGIVITPAPGAAADTLLGLDMRSEQRLVDHWLRGDDVTAVYESADARRLRTTAMWRLQAAGGATRAWELVVSAQTSLLHSDSMLAVVSAIDGTVTAWGTFRDGTVRWDAVPAAEATFVLLRRRGPTDSAGLNVLVGVHPGDAQIGRAHV